MIILGLRSKHDASAALVIDGELVAAAAEERFARKKHYYGVPVEAIKYCLDYAKIKGDQVDILARDGIKWSKTFQRLGRQMVLAWTPMLYKELIQKSWGRYMQRSPDTLSMEEAFLGEMGLKPNNHFVEHHYGHAAYAYYSSNLEKATVVVLDGRGHYLAGAVYIGQGVDLTLVSEFVAEGGSLGHFYSAVTDALGFKLSDGEGKTMGLACYGDPSIAYEELLPYAPEIRGLKSVRRKEWALHTEVVHNTMYGHYQESANLKLLIDKYGDKNVAASAQRILEEKVEQFVRNVMGVTHIRDLVGSGGIFLNIKSSKVLIDKGIVDSIYIPPGPGDDGQAAGYAMAAYAALTGKRPEPLKSAYLGPSYTAEEIQSELDHYEGIKYEKLDNIPEATAQLIANGKVIGWFQGRMEYGPRALGSRSVLADPRDPGMRDRINHLLKKRDWFMPFAPSVQKEYCQVCFKNYASSPYMNLAYEMNPPYDQSVPAIMHIDQTARPQEVDPEVNPLYHAVINEFRKITGIPMVLNTSFNRHGLPIVCTPRDAIDHLSWDSVNALVIGPYLATKV